MELTIRENSFLMRTDILRLEEFKELELIRRELTNLVTDCSGPVRQMCEHLVNSGGKRLRPLLVLRCGQIFSECHQELLRAAAAVELIHMASLAHDDVIDDSDLRRNRPSLKKIWGNHLAVLCGDYLFAKAFSILSGKELIPGLRLMVNAIQDMCQGEIFQTETQFDPQAGLDNYYKRITQKTAILVQCSCKIGAVIGGANEFQISAIEEYGLHLGVAFQIIDDVLDFCGKPEITGKPIGEDFRQGYFTLPIILLLSNEKYTEWVRNKIENRDTTRETLIQLNRILNESGTLDRAYQIAANHIERARRSLQLLPPVASVDFLDNLAVKLLARNF